MSQFSPTLNLKALKGPEDQRGALRSSVPSAYLTLAHWPKLRGRGRHLQCLHCLDITHQAAVSLKVHHTRVLPGEHTVLAASRLPAPTTSSLSIFLLPAFTTSSLTSYSVPPLPLRGDVPSFHPPTVCFNSQKLHTPDPGAGAGLEQEARVLTSRGCRGVEKKDPAGEY